MLGPILGAVTGLGSALLGKKGSSPRPGGGRKGQFEKQNEDLMYMISLGNMIAGGGVAGAATKNLIQNDPKTYRMLSDKFGQQFFEEEKAKYLADPNNRPSAPAMNPYMNPYMSLAQGAGPPKTGLALYDYQGGTYPNTGPFAGDTAGIGLPGSVGYSLWNPTEEAKKRAAARVFESLNQPRIQFGLGGGGGGGGAGAPMFGTGGGNLGSYTGGYGGPLKM